MFREKQERKGTGNSIIQSLAAKRIGQLKHTREKYGLNKCLAI